jgi:hypothetical protein
MKRYTVTLIYDCTWSVEVEAETPEQAEDLAYNHEDLPGSLCHQCSNTFDLGDVIEAMVEEREAKDE